MSDNSCYLRVETKSAKDIIVSNFIDKRYMEITMDDVYEVKTFACSESLFHEENDAICYFQCFRRESYNSLCTLLRTLLSVEPYTLVAASRYCCDAYFTQGYMLWRMD